MRDRTNRACAMFSPRRVAGVLILCLLALGGANPGQAKELEIVTTTTDIAWLYERIGGDRVESYAIAKGYQDPHYLEAKPSYVVKLRKADILGYVGLQLEVGWLPLLVDGARNQRILVGASGNVSLAEGLELLEIPEGELSRASGDVHPEGNPHYWLNPHNLATMAHTVEASLVRLDPEGADGYHARLEEFRAELDRWIPAWEERMAPYRGQGIVCYHKQWEYLLDWLGLDAQEYVENKPGIPPSPRHLQELVSTMRHREVPVLLASNFIDPGPAERVAAEAGAQLVVLPASIGGEPGIESFFDLFEAITTRLQAAFQRAEQGAGRE